MVNIGEVIREFRKSKEFEVKLAKSFVDRLFKKMLEKLKYKKAEMVYILAKLLMVDESA